jgi:hypothetical protein
MLPNRVPGWKTASSYTWLPTSTSIYSTYLPLLLYVYISTYIYVLLYGRNKILCHMSYCALSAIYASKDLQETVKPNIKSSHQEQSTFSKFWLTKDHVCTRADIECYICVSCEVYYEHNLADISCRTLVKPAVGPSTKRTLLGRKHSVEFTVSDRMADVVDVVYVNK